MNGFCCGREEKVMGMCADGFFCDSWLPAPAGGGNLTVNRKFKL